MTWYQNRCSHNDEGSCHKYLVIDWPNQCSLLPFCTTDAFNYFWKWILKSRNLNYIVFVHNQYDCTCINTKKYYDSTLTLKYCCLLVSWKLGQLVNLHNFEFDLVFCADKKKKYPLNRISKSSKYIFFNYCRTHHF